MRTDRWMDEQTEGRADGQTHRYTDMTKPTVALHNFVNAPKKFKKKEQNCFETLKS